jgi:nitroimidazol reductase NimA-like FMN-containing flavoprotein (pyridoxamine 5'-phosphate oxidase superfamily)
MSCCVQVDDIENVFKWQSVVAFGEFEEITDFQERQELLHDFVARFQKLTPVETISQETTAADEIVVFRIRIKRLSGISES